MDNVRSGNMKVSNMKTEIEKAVILLQISYITKRSERQIKDGTMFLDMISKPPYRHCRTVSQLKKKISEERNKIKAEMVKLDRFMPGHQFTIFETAEEVTEKEQQEVQNKKAEYAEQMHWLHKCLGICSNRDYFR